MVRFVKVTVIGAGGVGGYFGGKLAHAGLDVAFLTRGEQLRAIQERGLRVRSVHGDFDVRAEATEDPAAIGTADYVVVAVKSYSTEQVASLLPALTGSDTALISLQNGVDNEEKLAAVVGADRIVGGAAYIFATISEPGLIEHTGGPASLVVGEWAGGQSPRVGAFVEACRSAGITADESDNIRSVLWSKFAFICAQAGVTSAVRLPIGDILSAPAGRRLFHAVVAEVCAVAAGEGVVLPDDLPDKTLGFADGLDPGAFSSLHHDLVHGHRMELDALLGEVVRRGELAGVAVPTSQALYGVLQPSALKALSA